MATSPMRRIRREGLAWLEFDHLRSYPTLRHGISLRQEEGAEFDFSSRNQERARENIQRFCRALDLPQAQMVRVHQVHGRDIAVADKPGQFFEKTDGVCTAIPGLPVLLLGADCPLIIAYDPVVQAIGLAHAGWRGTVQRITANLIQTMMDKLSCKPDRMLAGIGPGICPRCYQVGQEVLDAARGKLHPTEQCFSKPSADSNGGGTWNFDLWESNRRQLIRVGVPRNQIQISGYCTYENPELFYSYRRQGQEAGRWAMLAGLAV